MDCTELQSILDSKRFCERSENGAKILTQCLYPSADPVFVHVGMWGDGFRVTDGGGAAESALFHGKDENAVFAGLNAAGARHSLRVEGGQLVAFVPDKDWLPSAIMAVANGAALAASTAVAHITKKHERSLASRILAQLDGIVPDKLIAKDYAYTGQSGKVWHVDYAITVPDRPVLIKAVSPHHNSIAANYTTFGDLRGQHNIRYSVFVRRPSEEDAALIRQVAELVPLKSLNAGAKEATTRFLH